METNPDSEAAGPSPKDHLDHLKAAAGDFKAAAGAKAENLRKAAEKKADELRAHAQNRAKEFRGAAGSAWTDARSRAKFWQGEGEAYVRENPTRAILIALGAGFLLGILLRK